MHDHVGVKDDETTKHQSTSNAKHKLQSFTPKENLQTKKGGGGGKKKKKKKNIYIYIYIYIYI